MSSGPTDDELVTRGRDGDEAALVELYLRYRPRLFGYLLRMANDHDLAEEAFAATFTRFFESLHRYRPEGRLAAYLFRIARSRLIEEQAARVRLRSTENMPLDDLVSPSVPPDEAASAAELSSLVRAAVGGLPEHLREVVILRIYEGLDYARIGEITGTGEATVRSRMRYALQWLRGALPQGPAVS
jgi:RNA polymerase sigma-70 factor (ECF subfamily)